jgi:hypothetical protein
MQGKDLTAMQKFVVLVGYHAQGNKFLITASAKALTEEEVAEIENSLPGFYKEPEELAYCQEILAKVKEIRSKSC